MTDAGEESAGTVLAKVSEGFEGLENQPATSEKYSGLDTGPATYSVAKQLRDNDMELHTDRQVTFCVDCPITNSTPQTLLFPPPHKCNIFFSLRSWL